MKNINIADLLDADMLAFEPAGLIGRLIALYGRTRYSHVGIFGWINDRPVCLEFSYYGGRIVPLDYYLNVKRRKIDVYRHKKISARKRREVVNTIFDLMGRSYNFGSILRLFFFRIPILRSLIHIKLSDDMKKVPVKAICSEAVSYAYRQVVGDPVPNLADCCTEPGDLVKSTYFEYLGRLGR